MNELALQPLRAECIAYDVKNKFDVREVLRLKELAIAISQCALDQVGIDARSLYERVIGELPEEQRVAILSEEMEDAIIEDEARELFPLDSANTLEDLEEAIDRI